MFLTGIPSSLAINLKKTLPSKQAQTSFNAKFNPVYDSVGFRVRHGIEFDVFQFGMPKPSTSYSTIQPSTHPIPPTRSKSLEKLSRVWNPYGHGINKVKELKRDLSIRSKSKQCINSYSDHEVDEWNYLAETKRLETEYETVKAHTKALKPELDAAVDQYEKKTGRDPLKIIEELYIKRSTSVDRLNAAFREQNIKLAYDILTDPEEAPIVESDDPTKLDLGDRLLGNDEMYAKIAEIINGEEQTDRLIAKILHYDYRSDLGNRRRSKPKKMSKDEEFKRKLQLDSIANDMVQTTFDTYRPKVTEETQSAPQRYYTQSVGKYYQPIVFSQNEGEASSSQEIENISEDLGNTRISEEGPNIIFENSPNVAFLSRGNTW